MYVHMGMHKLKSLIPLHKNMVILNTVTALPVVSVLSEIVTSDVKFSLPADVVIVDVFVADELFDTINEKYS